MRARFTAGIKKAIKSYCKWCCGGNLHEAALCPAQNCQLHAIRRNLPGVTNRQALQKVHVRCVDCSGGIGGPLQCPAKDCPLYPYRSRTIWRRSKCG